MTDVTEHNVLTPPVVPAELSIIDGGRYEVPEPIRRGVHGATDRRRRPSRWSAVGVALTGMGVLLLLFFLYFYAFTSLTQTRDQQRLLQSLASNRKAVHALVVGHLPSEGKPVAILTIPVLHERQVVTMGTSSADLQQGPGLMAQTALPGDPGNAVIAGRRVSYGAPFGSLDHLARGNTIEVLDGAGSFRFRVVKVSTVPGGFRDLVPGRSQSWLTLVTSSSPLLYNGTVVVVARSVSPVPAVVPSMEPGDAAVRLDLGGDRAGGFQALAWAAVFLFGLWVTVRAVRRWRPPWLVYVLSAPVLLACGLFACESLARMLPATL